MAVARKQSIPAHIACIQDEVAERTERIKQQITKLQERGKRLLEIAEELDELGVELQGADQ